MNDDAPTTWSAPATFSDPGTKVRLLVCFFVPMLTAWLLATVWVPLELHQAEEYLTLAQSPDGGFSLLRPPGYIFFLHILSRLSGGFPQGAYAPVYFTQAVLLGCAAVAFFLVARRWLEPAAACVLALAFGCHPLTLVLAGYLHYDLLHLALLVIMAWCMVRAFLSPCISWRWAILAGVVAGLTTLTRPMTLLFPPVLAIVLVRLRKADSRHRSLSWLIGVTAMALTLVPRVVENFHRTHRLFPVNAQTGAAVWPMTVTALQPTSVNFPWLKAWTPAGSDLITSHLGPDAVRPDAFMTQTIVLDDLFKADAWTRFRAHPSIYLENVAANLVFFWTGDSRRFIQAFCFYQIAERPSRTTAWAVGYFVLSSALMHALALYGWVRAWWQREPTLLVAGSVFLTLWLVHALVYLDARYIYAGLPFFLWFAAYGLRELLPARCRRDLAAATVLAALSFIGLFCILL